MTHHRRRVSSRSRLTVLSVIVVGAALVASCGSEDGTASPVAPSTSTSIAGDVLRDRQATAALFAGIKPDGPGCTVAVARDEKIVFAEGYGLASIDPRTPNTATTVMDIGSTSKQFTALAMLLLADDGKLSLDDDVHAYVPELPDYGVKVTLRQMMHHQSGIPDYVTLLISRLNERTTAEDALAVLRGTPKLAFSPGAKFSYSNSNYFLFSLIVERGRGSDASAVPADSSVSARGHRGGYGSGRGGAPQGALVSARGSAVGAR